MATVNWIELLGWTQDQLQELRFAGFSFLKEGKYERALLYFEGLVVLAPDSAYDRQTLGALYLQVNQLDKALAMLNAALQLEPTHEPTLLNKVKAQFLLGQREEAMAVAQTLSLSVNPQIAGDASALILAYR